MRRTTEDYLKTILLLQEKNGCARGVDIAAELGVSKPTVSIQVKRLCGDGFAQMNAEHEIFLTDEGRSVAQEVLERNVTILRLLKSLGVNDKTAGEDACRMEHAVSAESLAALKRLTEERKKEKAAHDDK